MNPAPPSHDSPGMSVSDIYYIIFRHKWRIMICALVGFTAAAALFRFHSPPFQSEAKLYIRYVITEGKTLGPAESGQTKSPDQRGETIMESEQQILTSLDLAKQVAETVGPAKILAKVGGGKDLNQAAARIRKSLIVTVPTRTSVIDIIFSHPDPEVVQPVLSELVASYRKRHIEIHQSAGGLDDSLTQETDNLRAQLSQTEEDLRKTLNKAGVVSLADAKKNQAEQMARIRDEIQTAEADFAERSALLQAVTKQPSATPNATPAASSITAPDAGAVTPATVTPASATSTAAPPPAEPEITPAQVDAYKAASARVDLLRKAEQELLTQFTDKNSRVQDIRAQLSEAENGKRKLEEEHPGLIRSAPVASAPPPVSRASPPEYDVAIESGRLIALQSKIKVLNTQLDNVRTEANNLNQLEGQITDLQRKRDLQDTKYRYYADRQDQARIDDALGSDRINGISVIQEPSPPAIDRAKSLKILGMLAVSGIAVGLAWAFVIELFLDRTVRRPIDIERMLKLPLFLTIPELGRKRPRRLKASKKNQTTLNGHGEAELVPWDGAHALHPFHETLRDRLIGYFESRNLTHKPKLVAVTGLGKDAGVTTTAAGLASCLSETGEGNVLLVDMTPGQGSAQQFYKGKAVCGLDEIFDTRDTAQIQDKLYVVTEGQGGDKLSGILPQRFSKLVPRLKASNFDYIIFDMPPVSQISITPRLAGFMDMVLLVIESEKTDRDIVQRATALLAASKAHVGAVLNRSRSYVPARLHQEYLGNI